MWESNSPRRPQAPHAGFEDQRAHQHPSTPIVLSFLILNNINIYELMSQEALFDLAFSKKILLVKKPKVNIHFRLFKILNI